MKQALLLPLLLLLLHQQSPIRHATQSLTRSQCHADEARTLATKVPVATAVPIAAVPVDVQVQREYHERHEVRVSMNACCLGLSGDSPPSRAVELAVALPAIFPDERKVGVHVRGGGGGGA
jgi:hypothetical protein